jgi:hypothetical protein
MPDCQKHQKPDNSEIFFGFRICLFVQNNHNATLHFEIVFGDYKNLDRVSKLKAESITLQ